MTASRDPDRMIHAFLFEGEEQLHDQVYDAVRAGIEQKRQRAVVGPWRLPIMNKLVPIGLGVAAVVGVLLVGSRLLAPPSGVGGPTTEPSASAAPSPTSPPPLTETFTSERHGFSISYPSGWLTRPATEPWTTDVTDFYTPGGDIVHDPVRTSDLWIAVASQSLGAPTPDEWVAEKLAFDDGCPTGDPIAIDGAAGLIGADGCTRAAVTIDGRGYFFWLYTGGDDPSLGLTYDQAWFESVLATVQLEPAAAVDAAPPLTGTFTSERHGISFSYPAGWLTQPATEAWTTGLPDCVTTAGDIVRDPVRDCGLWIVVASQPLGNATPAEWVAEMLALDECATTEPITVDGTTGLIGADNCNEVAVTVDGRGYFIWLYTSPDDPSLAVTYDRAWFEEFLATVQLEPAAAVDAAPSASP